MGAPHTMTTASRHIDVPCSCRRGEDHYEDWYDKPIDRAPNGEVVTGSMVLAARMEPNDADAETVREYLAALACQVWIEGEGFSGKRPFGNSDWYHDLQMACWLAGYVPGPRPEDGYGFTREQSELIDRLIVKACSAMGAA